MKSFSCSVIFFICLHSYLSEATSLPSTQSITAPSGLRLTRAANAGNNAVVVNTRQNNNQRQRRNNNQNAGFLGYSPNWVETPLDIAISTWILSSFCFILHHLTSKVKDTDAQVYVSVSVMLVQYLMLPGSFLWGAFEQVYNNLSLNYTDGEAGAQRAMKAQQFHVRATGMSEADAREKVLKKARKEGAEKKEFKILLAQSFKLMFSLSLLFGIFIESGMWEDFDKNLFVKDDLRLPYQKKDENKDVANLDHNQKVADMIKLYYASAVGYHLGDSIRVRFYSRRKNLQWLGEYLLHAINLSLLSFCFASKLYRVGVATLLGHEVAQALIIISQVLFDLKWDAVNFPKHFPMSESYFVAGLGAIGVIFFYLIPVYLIQNIQRENLYSNAAVCLERGSPAGKVADSGGIFFGVLGPSVSEYICDRNGLMWMMWGLVCMYSQCFVNMMHIFHRKMWRNMFLIEQHEHRD